MHGGIGPGPIYMPNAYLDTVFNALVSPSTVPNAILFLHVKSLSLQERNNYAICKLPHQIETYSLG